MRFLKIFIWIYLVIISIITSIVYYDESHLIDNYKELNLEQIYHNGNDITHQIEIFLEEIKSDFEFLEESEEIVGFFEKKLNVNIGDVQLVFEKQVYSTIKEMESYVENNPNLSYDELLLDEKFQNIVVKKWGEDGYNVLLSPELTILLHKYPSAVGIDRERFKLIGPKVFEVLDGIESNGGENAGFYEWIDPEGIYRDKYTFCKYLGKLDFNLCATGYVDEYNENLWFANVFAGELRYFQNENEFKNLILVKNDGEIIWTAENSDLVNKNLLSSEFTDSNLFHIYSDLFEYESNDVKFFLEENERLQVFAGVKIFSTKNISLGYLIIEIDERKVKDIIEIFRKELESDLFIINSHNKYFISNEKLKTGIKSQVDEICDNEQIFDLNKNYSSIFIELYDGNRGDNNFVYIEKLNFVEWCVVSSISEKKINYVLKKNSESIFIYLFPLFIFCFLVVFGISVILDSKFKISKLGEKK
jgi:hypothetical protein